MKAIHEYLTYTVPGQTLVALVLLSALFYAMYWVNAFCESITF